MWTHIFICSNLRWPFEIGTKLSNYFGGGIYLKQNHEIILNARLNIKYLSFYLTFSRILSVGDSKGNLSILCLSKHNCLIISHEQKLKWHLKLFDSGKREEKKRRGIRLVVESPVLCKWPPLKRKIRRDENKSQCGPYNTRPDTAIYAIKRTLINLFLGNISGRISNFLFRFMGTGYFGDIPIFKKPFWRKWICTTALRFVCWTKSGAFREQY